MASFSPSSFVIPIPNEYSEIRSSNCFVSVLERMADSKQFCNFCAKNSEKVRGVSDIKININNNVIEIQKLLNIFQKDIVYYFLDNMDSFICPQCLRKLKKCYEFVQQLKESELKLQKGKEITSEHDYFGVPREEQGRTETLSEKVTVNKETQSIETNINYKPILPKSSNNLNLTKEATTPKAVKSRFYKCLKCKETFKSFKSLKGHEREYCRNLSCKEFETCKYCHKSFSKEESLKKHISIKHSQGEYLCCLCEGKSFAGKGYLARHIEKIHQHNSLQYFCGECDFLFCVSTYEELQQHFHQNHPLSEEKSALDEHTHTALNDEDMDLEMHEEFLDEFLLAHTNENSFQFSECWEALDLHLPDMLHGSSTNLNHDQSDFTKAFPCPKCFEQFKNPQPLLKHLAEIHNMPVLICRTCSKSFASFEDFRKHKLEKCQKNYNLSKSMQLECPYCLKTFANSLNLKQHLRIVHSLLKRHICQLCDKQFSTLDHLKKHVLSQHQNERKHNCSVCNKSFTQLGHLKQHLAIHTTGKAIHCSDCSLMFWRKIDLLRHRKKKHQEVT